MQRASVLLWSFLLLWLQPIACQAQEAIIKTQQIQREVVPIAKTIDLKVGEVLRVPVDKLPPDPIGKIAVFLGDVDITSQVEIVGNELVYRSSLVPMSVGEQTLTIFTIKSIGRWDPIATFSIKVEPEIAQVSPSPTDPKLPSSTNEAATKPANSTGSVPATQPSPNPSATPSQPRILSSIRIELYLLRLMSAPSGSIRSLAH